jgi:putative tricarboxylic transport membrane protein
MSGERSGELINTGMIAALCMLLYGIVILVQALSLKYYTSYGPGPGFFPVWISGLLILLAILYLVESVKKNAVYLKDILPGSVPLKKIGSLTAGLLFFIFTADILGFFISGIVLLLAMFLWDFKFLKALVLSLVFMLILAVTFQILLKVSLPMGFMDRLF